MCLRALLMEVLPGITEKVQSERALARLEGPALDWLNALRPGEWLGYTSLFIFGAACMLVSMLMLAPVQEKQP